MSCICGFAQLSLSHLHIMKNSKQVGAISVAYSECYSHPEHKLRFISPINASSISQNELGQIKSKVEELTGIPALLSYESRCSMGPITIFVKPILELSN